MTASIININISNTWPNNILTQIGIWHGVLIQNVGELLKNTNILLKVLLDANVKKNIASFVKKKNMLHQVVNMLRCGQIKKKMMVKTFNGWKPTQKVAQSVEYKLRKIKDVIIWTARNVSFHIVGYVLGRGLSMVVQLVDGMLVTSSKNLRRVIKIFRHNIK